MTKKEADFFPEGHCFRGQKEIGRRGGGSGVPAGKKLTKNVMLMKRFLRREGGTTSATPTQQEGGGGHSRLSQLNSVASTISNQSTPATRTNSYATTGGASSLFSRNSSVRSARSTKSNATVLTAVSSLTGSSSVYSSSSNSAYKKSKTHHLFIFHHDLLRSMKTKRIIRIAPKTCCFPENYLK